MKLAVLSAANSIHTVKIVNSLAELGHTVTLYSLPNHRDIDHAIIEKVSVVYLAKSGYMQNHRQLRQLLNASGAQVLYAHYATGYGTLARRTGFHPTVLAVWGSDVYDFPQKSPFHALLVRRNLSFADAIFSTSFAMAKRTKAYTDKEITVTPFGVDLSEFFPASAHKQEGFPVRIGFLKGVSEKYGIRHLIEAFAMLMDHLPNVPLQLAVYGGGNQLNEMKQLAAALKIEANVIFYGQIPHAQAADALRTMDIFCVPSTLDSESFGVSAVEAMACGLPCIVSDVDGLQEVTRHGVTGLTVPRSNPVVLCEALEKLIQDPVLCCQMGQAGRKRVEELYDWRQNIRTIENGLLKAMGSL